MATTTRPVHVHGAEVSTDRSATLAYAGTIAVLLAALALLGAAWAAAHPREGADLSVPAPGADAPVRQLQYASSFDPQVIDVVQPVPGGPGTTELSAARAGAGAASATVDPTRPEATDG